LNAVEAHVVPGSGAGGSTSPVHGIQNPSVSMLTGVRRHLIVIG
jgi:hypothetical protein